MRALNNDLFRSNFIMKSCYIIYNTLNLKFIQNKDTSINNALYLLEHNKNSYKILIKFL